MSTEQFCNYFKQQNASSQNNKRDPETDVKTSSNKVVMGPLDYQITDEEFDAALNKPKTNKPPGTDNILNEVLKIGKNAI